jgi:CO dehydrogenase nickel-insertion accessory protein CooC1
VGRVSLIINRVNGDRLPGALEKAIEEFGLNLVGLIPSDAAVNELDAQGLPVVELPATAPSREALERILASLDGGL